MEAIAFLAEAIANRKSIEFEYTISGKVVGKRCGNPHAVFIHPSTKNISVHIFQTGGVSDTEERIPDWRQCIVEHITAIKILHEMPPFEIAVGYKPNSPMYSNVLYKI